MRPLKRVLPQRNCARFGAGCWLPPSSSDEGDAAVRLELDESFAPEAYRLEVTGKATSEQLARESEIIRKNPLLIQKALADKLSDKIQVIIAPPPADGGFVGSALLGKTQTASREGQ